MLPTGHPQYKREASALDEHRKYPDGEAIPSALPPAYRKSRKDGPTKGQACVNCSFYKENHEDHRFYCSVFEAPVRPQYWCKKYKAAETSLEETYNDYPDSAVNNARKVLRWRDEHGDEVKGMTSVGWRRANQLAKRERISRDTIARMASFKRHQKNAEIDPKFKSTPWKDRGYVAWLGWGGTSGINWAIRKREQIDKKKNNKMNKYGFNSNGIEKNQVNPGDGKMSGVSLISTGEALGHELYVDQTSIESILSLLSDTRLAAYITHRGALFEDRLTREIGYFDNFRIEGNRLLGDFQAFESFKTDDTKQYNRLFEMADKLPENFGLSIVFSANHVWATSDGDVQMEERPDNAKFKYPSIRATEVMSADFVDTPAANEKGLFSKIDNNNNIEMTESEITENETDESVFEDTEVAENFDSHSDEEMGAHEDKELGGHEEDEEKMEEEEKSMEAKIEELEKALKERDEELAKLKEELGAHEDEKKEMEQVAASAEKDLKDRVTTLESLIQGSAPIKNSSEEEYIPSKEAKEHFIAEYAKEHNCSLFTATLKVAKIKPELF